MNVYKATQNRLNEVFNNFDNIYVSFSGGKDSGVLLNLCLTYIKQYNWIGKFSVFHIDYEAQYQQTTDYVADVFDGIRNNIDIDIYHICLPISAQCATSMYQNTWIPWDDDKKNIWVRNLPEHSIHENIFDFFKKGMWDYDVQSKFPLWLHKKNNATKTCGIIGIRTEESLNRWRAIHQSNGGDWLKNVEENVCYAYPVFDWKTEDIWIANAKFGWKYNTLYDLFYQAGLTIYQMRVASPFNDYAKNTLNLYRVIDPNNWGKMIGRVDGVNFTGIYGGTTAMGWKSIELPSGHTWKSYLEFLLSTLPEDIRNNYKRRFETSIKFWKNVGGCLKKETVQFLMSLNIPYDDTSTTKRRSKNNPVKMDYLDDIKCDDFKSLPTYKRMCICILKNDHFCKYMGFQPTIDEVNKRKHAEETYKIIKNEKSGI